MRLDKFFSEQKILSRTQCSKCVKNGEIAVNGVTVKKADVKIDESSDVITLNGERVFYKKYVYILVNKPIGVVSATEDAADKTVIDLLPTELKKYDLFPCGRLDKDTTGLVVLTNDGASAHAALSPKRHVEKEYSFKTADAYSDADVSAIERGITLKDGYTTKSCRIVRLNDNEGRIILTEGKYHEIKRLFGARGNKIIALRRIRFGDIVLGDIAEGAWRYMTEEEEKSFKSARQ